MGNKRATPREEPGEAETLKGAENKVFGAAGHAARASGRRLRGHESVSGVQVTAIIHADASSFAITSSWGSQDPFLLNPSWPANTRRITGLIPARRGWRHIRYCPPRMFTMKGIYSDLPCLASRFRRVDILELCSENFKGPRTSLGLYTSRIVVYRHEMISLLYATPWHSGIAGNEVVHRHSKYCIRAMRGRCNLQIHT